MKEENNDIVNQKSKEMTNGKSETKEEDNSVLQNLLSKNDKFKEIFMLIGNNSNTLEAKKRKKGNKENKSKTIDVNQKRNFNLDEEIEKLKKKQFSHYNNSKESTSTNNSNNGINGKIAVLLNEINFLNIEKANKRIVNQNNNIRHRIKNDNVIRHKTKKIKSFFIIPKGKEDFSFNIKQRKNLNSWILSEKEIQGNTFLHSKKNEIQSILSLTKQSTKTLTFFRNGSHSHFSNDYYLNELDKFSNKLKKGSINSFNGIKTKKFLIFKP